MGVSGVGGALSFPPCRLFSARFFASVAVLAAALDRAAWARIALRSSADTSAVPPPFVKSIGLVVMKTDAGEDVDFRLIFLVSRAEPVSAPPAVMHAVWRAGGRDFLVVDMYRDARVGGFGQYHQTTMSSAQKV